MNPIPENLQYTQDHEWVSIQDGVATVGITDFAQSELGDIVFVEIETLDEDIAAGDIFGTVEAVKTVSDLFQPVSGRIIEVNEKVQDEPSLVNEEPYGDGWLIKIKLADDADTSTLMDASAYKKLVG